VIPHRPEDWHPAAFILGCGLSIALLMSWFFEPTRSLWLTFDEKVFWALNDSLAWGTGWQVFWAVANNRAVDVVAALSMIGLFAHFVLRKARDRMDFFVAVGLMLTGLIYVGSQLTGAIFVERPSPTWIYPNALRLSELVSRIPTKDLSSDSFPGDHATVLFICAGVATYYLPRAYAAATWAMAIVFMAPRLMGGAHWMTDYLVGSAAVAGFVLFYVFATPLHSIMTDRLELLIRRYRSRWRDWIHRRRF
jgi:membrane-associated phospholipid phosphatase